MVQGLSAPEVTRTKRFPLSTAIRTQVGILGAGPAGLLFAHVLQKAGIVESPAAEVLAQSGVSDRISNQPAPPREMQNVQYKETVRSTGQAPKSFPQNTKEQFSERVQFISMKSLR